MREAEQKLWGQAWSEWEKLGEEFIDLRAERIEVMEKSSYDSEGKLRLGDEEGRI